jgi:hypothetical protein
MIDISKVFTPSSEPISQFFRRPGLGFYIPLYQRPYSWDKENIDQLMEDICSGVLNLIDDDDAIHFMGTSILLQENNPTENIEPIDNRALPTRIDNVIDGQQRICTIALLACELYKRFLTLKGELSNDAIFKDLKSQIDSNNKILLEVFSVDLDRGIPSRKPIIIRGSVDQWTLDGDENKNYKSEISNYISLVIKAALLPNFDFPEGKINTTVGNNVKRIRTWLNNVEESDFKDKIDYPSAKDILLNVKQSYLWAYDRDELKALIIEDDGNISKANLKTLTSITLLLTFSHYFLERCCFSIIEPTKEHWAFDMFQSLNATGTPLTAIETFLPLVVNYVNKNGGEKDSKYKGSESEEQLKQVEKALSSTSTNKKAKITNEYVNSLSLIYEGTPKSNQFSIQRAWLNNAYNQLDSAYSRESFIKLMGNLGTYWENVLGFDARKLPSISGLHFNNSQEEKLGTLCTQYLNDANHKMANTVLSLLYIQALNDVAKVEDFFNGAKALAAFFTLWRAVLPNSGLDEIYKKLLRGQNNDGICFKNSKGILNLNNLKAYFKEVLIEKDLFEREKWINRASENLKYSSAAKVCRFALFLSAHDTEADLNEPGLMQITTTGVRSYLEPEHWIASEFSDIEHIAPRERKNSDRWDENLYLNDKFESVGNLTLLPTKVNISASNKGWKEKLTYYKHLSETNPTEILNLSNNAKHIGVHLNQNTIEILRNSKYSDHMKPIVAVDGDNISWDNKLVNKRSERICTIVWDRINLWLH